MPASRCHKSKRITEKSKFRCDYETCNRSFTRPYDLRRHKRTHCGYNDREFACTYPSCDFRSNQQAGLKCHVNSIHTGVRSECELCAKTFSDPSSLSKHKVRVHEQSSQDGANDQYLRDGHGTRDNNWKPRTESQPKRHAVPYTPYLHKSVIRRVEENSRHGAKDILGQFATFALRAEGDVDASQSHHGPISSSSGGTPPLSDRSSSDQYSQESSRAPSTPCSDGFSSLPGYVSIVHSPSPAPDSDYEFL